MAVDTTSAARYSGARVLVRLLDARRRELSSRSVIVALNRDVRVGGLPVPARARAAEAKLV